MENRLERRIAKLEAALSKHKRMFEADEEVVSDPKVQKELEAISKSLKNAGLAEFVGDINKMMSDEKGRLALELFAGVLPEDQLEELGLDHVEFAFAANNAIPVSNLHPTQNEIGFSNSLKKPVANAYNCIDTLINGQSVELGIPIITCNGKLIIDGHHRWSQTACVNPDATMKCLDLQIRTGTSGIDFQDAGDVLKVTQALIAAIALKKGATSLPSSDSNALENLYKMSETDLYDKIMSMPNKDGLTVLASKKRVANGKFKNADATARAVADSRFSDLGDEEKAAVYLTSNCVQLPKPDPNATARKYMPQTNGGDGSISMNDLEKAAEDGLNVKEQLRRSRKLSKIESHIKSLEKRLYKNKR